MTKDEMLKEYGLSNYETIQNHIKEAMQKGEHCVYVGKEWYAHDFKPEWVCLDSTKEKLIEDGFDVDEFDYHEWKINW